MDAAAYGLIRQNNGEFKFYVSRYKYAGRYPEFPDSYCRQQAELFLAVLEGRLADRGHLGGGHGGMVDAAIFPFVRQFAAVDENGFQRLPYSAVKRWLTA